MKKFGFLLILALLSALPAAAQNAEPVVQAVLFYSPSCPHCHVVIEESLPPLMEKYGDQLQIVAIDASQQVGAQLYTNTIQALSIPQERVGVPAMVIGSDLLVGSVEIPQRLPGLIEAGLAVGGIGWPAIPGLQEAVPDLPPSAASMVEPTTLPAAEPIETGELAAVGDLGETAVAQPSGFGLAWGVMALLIIALLYAVWRLARTASPLRAHADAATLTLQHWGFPLLIAAGLGVALYLAYVEITATAAVCGPVGECNQVQSSSYAELFGIPIAVLGAGSYLALGGLWLVVRRAGDVWRDRALLLLVALSFFAAGFSVYLTALDLFVIRAVCAWCLASAVITALLLLLAVRLPALAPDVSARIRGA